MITLRSAGSRGKANFGWLDSRHTFSFGHYHDPQHMGFGPLRVINEDKVLPAAGFDTHGHRDMEIISYVLSGELAHKDSIGTGSVIRPGDVQRMTAGTGIRHSEFNNSSKEPVHFLQIWIEPEKLGLAPGYEQKHFDASSMENRWCVVACPDGSNGAVTVHQDVRLLVSKLAQGKTIDFTLAENRQAWMQVARGSVSLNNTLLDQGDGVAITDLDIFRVTATEDSEVLLFDLPQ